MTFSNKPHHQQYMDGSGEGKSSVALKKKKKKKSIYTLL